MIALSLKGSVMLWFAGDGADVAEPQAQPPVGDSGKLERAQERALRRCRQRREPEPVTDRIVVGHGKGFDAIEAGRREQPRKVVVVEQVRVLDVEDRARFS